MGCYFSQSCILPMEYNLARYWGKVAVSMAALSTCSFNFICELVGFQLIL